MSHVYPLLLDVSRRPVVVVGGGAVAVRKAVGLLAAGAGRVVAVAPRFDPKMPRGVGRIVAEYRAAHLAGAGLVFAATDRADVNRAVVRDARRRGVLCCRADSEAGFEGDFIVPASFVRGRIVIAVSAGSPAMAAYIRDQLARRIEPAWIKMAAALATLRPAIVENKAILPARRREILKTLAGDEAIAVLSSGGIRRLRRWLKERFVELGRGMATPTRQRISPSPGTPGEGRGEGLPAGLRTSGTARGAKGAERMISVGRASARRLPRRTNRRAEARPT